MDTESNLSKSNFLSRMSHEMRTPLNAIMGMCTIAQTTNDPEKRANCLDKINEASEHLLGMINEILDLAKIEAGNLKLTNAEFDLRQMLRKMVRMVKFPMDAKKQKLILDFDPALPENIISDEQKLILVLDNFLSNAVKFTPPEGSITLSVKKQKEEGQSYTLRVAVTDTGIGISKEGREKIFSLFEQVDGSLVRKYGGIGMGLRISSSLVQLLGGEIIVESEPGKGSSFSFEITVERGSEKSLQKDENGNADEKPIFSGKTILLVEDMEINREIVLSLLEDTGITMDCAENGKIALEKYKASPGRYHLILMDIQMPEMDGYEATLQIRAFETEQNAYPIPIVAMTANVFKDDVEKCLAVGMSSHLGKPVDFDELIKQLDRFLTQP
jgi:CheY-like chemotaxis protein